MTYLSGTSVYLDAGERDGLTEGALLDVIRRGSPVAQLRARFVSPSRSQCDLVPGGATDLQVGDSVRYTRRSGAAVAAALAKDTAAAVQITSAAARSRPLTGTNQLHGRLGVRYLAAWQRDSGAARLAQPASDVRIDGAVPGIASLEIAVDARARRTQSVTIDGVTAPSRTSTLIYQSSLAWRAAPGARVRLGRQYSTELSAVSLFDGALLEMDSRHVGAGAFAGTQPDVLTMGYSTRVREYGAYVSARATPLNSAASLTTGAIGSYDGGQIDREFGFVSASWYGRLASLYAVQELDYNRGWKQTLGTPTFLPTSTFASLRVRATDAVSIQAGYDSRRSVRLYRNYITPAVTFDDSFRTGIWGGLFAEIGSHANASFDARHSKGGLADTTRVSGAANVFTMTASLHDETRIPSAVRTRTSVFRTPAASGWLQTLAVSGNLTETVQLEASGGLRRDIPAAGTASAAISPRLTVRWLELDADVSLGRSWYLLFAASSERGGWEGSDQIYSALTYRF
ncbi:MAG TPA: hypothetical protein VFT29_00295 [Gemmatimonadaceae bacterium]|nr:hypothetical protein [Gemmatimonadaceae bacterium]